MTGDNMSAEEAELLQRAEPFGLSLAQARMAVRMRMPLERYAAFSNCRTVHDAEKVRRALREVEAARVEAERLAAVEKARKAL